MNRAAPFVLAVVLVLAVSAGVRFFHLGTPRSLVFDEVYYAKDAKTILKGRVGATDKAFPWEPGKEVSWPHPEWGKQTIAVGILLFGDNAFGRRFMSALAGLALLAVVYPLARRLGLARPWALAALVLAAADTLGIAQSRITTLDVFVALWSVVCVWLALRYAQSGRRRSDLLLCGVAAGLALGTKWSGALALGAALVVLLLFREPLGGETARERARRAGRAALWPLALLVALPVALYVAGYWQYFVAGHTWSQWWELQRQMVTFNFGLHATHTYASHAPTWILDLRPVWYYFDGKGGVDHGIVAIGNPLLWWAATAALLVTPVVALVKRRRGLVVAPLLVAVLYFPWFATGRTSFLYYMTPVAPLLAVLVASALAALSGAAVDPFAAPDLGGDGAHARGADVGEPLTPSSRPSWVVSAALFAGGLLLAALLWYQVAELARLLFWTLPGRVIPLGHAHGAFVGSWLGLAVGVGLATLGVVLLLGAPHLQRLRGRLAWLYVGIVAGWAIAYLPIVVDIGISPERFYRLMWFSNWI